MGLHRVALEMCVPIACSPDGVNILLNNKLLQFINELNPVLPVPVLLEDSMGLGLVGENLQTMRQESEELVEEALSPVLRVLRVMLAVSPLCVPLLEGCALYLHRNADVVRHLLGLKMKSLKGLTLVKSLVGIISVVSAYRGQRSPLGSASSNRFENAPTKFPIAEIFMVELNGLLRRIGLYACLWIFFGSGMYWAGLCNYRFYCYCELFFVNDLVLIVY
jgi:hypothetical protein